MRQIILGAMFLSAMFSGCNPSSGSDDTNTTSAQVSEQDSATTNPVENDPAKDEDTTTFTPSESETVDETTTDTQEDTTLAEDEPTDPQYQNLKLLAGKTLSLTYKYPLLSTDIAVMTDEVTDISTMSSDNNFKYVLNGVGPYGNLFICFDIKSTAANATPPIAYPYQYYCTWDFSSGGKNAFAFNVEGSKLVGVYEYVASYSSENPLIELQTSPDATLYSISSITTTATTTNKSAMSAIGATQTEEDNKLIYEEYRNEPVNKVYPPDDTLKQLYEEMLSKKPL